MVCIAHKGQTLSKEPFYEYTQHVQPYLERGVIEDHEELINKLNI